MALKSGGELDFINFKNDTVYILETFYTEAAPLMVGAIWNRTGFVNYSFIAKQREQPGNKLVDSTLTNYLLNNGNINTYYQGLPQHVVKNKYFFEKIIFQKGRYRILYSTTFLW